MNNIYKVPAVEQAVRVMLYLADGGSNSKSLTDICRKVGIHRSKAFSILSTLSEYDLVKKNANRKGHHLAGQRLYPRRTGPLPAHL
jgi:DNA-binding IclR family transcriptional regulator